MTPLNDFLTTAQAASVLELHQQTITRFCRQGKLNGDKANNGWLIPRTESVSGDRSLVGLIWRFR